MKTGRWIQNSKILMPENWICFEKLAEKGSGKSASDMLPFLMSAAASGKKNGLNFSQNEISAVLEVMKAGKSPQEAAKIDKIVNLMRMIH